MGIEILDRLPDWADPVGPVDALRGRGFVASLVGHLAVFPNRQAASVDGMEQQLRQFAPPVIVQVFRRLFGTQE